MNEFKIATVTQTTAQATGGGGGGGFRGSHGRGLYDFFPSARAAITGMNACMNVRLNACINLNESMNERVDE